MNLTTTILLLAITALATAYTGDMTYYDPGVGSCGLASGGGDAVVALSIAMMNNPANPNANPKCGTQISIHNPSTGTTHSATIVDTCVGCALYDIDVSPSLFKQVAPDGDGRVQGIWWGGTIVGG